MSLAALPTSVQELDAVPDNPAVTTTNSILQRIAAGDTSAVAECLDHYSGLVWSLAVKSCPSQADAEDSVQEIFVELWQKASSFDPSKASETTFVAMIARRRLIDRNRRRSSVVEMVNIDSEQLDTPTYLPDQDAELADEAAKAAACLKRLPETQQQVISMSIHGGQPYSRIANLLSIPLGTVKSYARRSLLQLRKCMARPVTDGGAS
ncbi:MAG TPA: RNA polymerase subunit sigma-24 [Planctomycetaceae bacterium]|nr:RNA polymerase subunit sigma-24 [Planctomycetaceae bacterium]